MDSICNHDCFNCKFEDCICDDMTPDDYVESNARDISLQTPQQKAEHDWRKAYNAKHREKIAAYKRAYYESHMEWYADYRKAYYAENRDRLLAYQKEYYRKNKRRRGNASD